MRFFEILTLATDLLRRERQVSYRALKRQFELDDDYLADLCFELIEVRGIAIDHANQLLLWAGDDSTVVARLAATAPAGKARRTAAIIEPRAPAAPAGRPATPDPVPIERARSAKSANRLTMLSASAPPPAAELPASDAERRQLSVMFCDLDVDKKPNALLDAEELREILQRYHNLCSNSVTAFGGYVARYMGSSVLVYFGYPQANEHDAERAVRSAMDIVAVLLDESAVSAAASLSVRIGIATGAVVVGDLIGSGAAQEHQVIGTTPNLASRLKSCAGSNQIVIDPLTHELAGSVFDYQSLGPQAMRGMDVDVPAWQVVGEHEDEPGSAPARETKKRTTSTVLVGRQEELGLLLRAWHQSKRGLGQIVLLSGEAGIGKSRLIEALSTQLRREGFTRITLRCSPYHIHSALYPVINHVRDALDWKREDDNAARLAKLETMLAGYRFPTAETTPLLASLLSLPLPEERYPPLQLVPQQQKQQTLDAAVAWLLEEAERRPVIQVWEDLHWADPTTLELLALIIDQCPTVPVLNVMTFRPDFIPPWPHRSHMTPITLSRLERPEVERIIGWHTSAKALPREVVEHIIRKTDGVPLYVEELTKSILASDFLQEKDDRFELTGPLSELAIPATLQDSLMARLDRIPTVREVAQMGAVFGREFAYEMLQALDFIEETALKNGLRQLVEAELLYQRGRPPRAQYMFKHALIQDAAYQSLLKRTRQYYHLQVAGLLEKSFAEIVAANPEMLARHYTEAGYTEKALDYWYRAGQHAAGRSNYLEALAHLDMSLLQLHSLPENHSRHQRELQIQTMRAAALQATRGFGARATGEAYNQAHMLCRQLGGAAEIFPVLHGVFLFHMLRGEVDAGYQAAQECLQLARDQSDVIPLLFGHRSVGSALLHLGEFTRAREHLQEMLTMAESLQLETSTSAYGIHPRTAAPAFLSLTLFALGYPEQAQAAARDCVEQASRDRHPHNLSYALYWSNMTLIHCQDDVVVRDQAEQLIALGEQHGFSQWQAFGIFQCGCALARLNKDEDDGIAHMRSGLEKYQALGSELYLPLMFALLAEALIAAERTEEAEKLLSDAIVKAERMHERWFLAELYRRKGELLFRQSGTAAVAQAETYLQQAYDIAHAQQAKSWELRAATSLSRLWRAQGDPARARVLLEEVYDWFSEGYASEDLVAAKTLLDELA